MNRWLSETRGPTFELFRHFLRTFFDSDLVTATEHTPMALVGAVAVVMQWMFLYVQPIKLKYEYLSKLTTPGPYRDALRADELWLITLAMAAMGVLTGIKWQALFPSLRDYRALASLPLRPAQIFAAKLLALLTVSVAAVVALNLFPGFGFAGLSGGRWTLQPSSGTRALSLFATCAAGSYFFFFGLAALQGLLLLLLPPRIFGRVSGALQGLLVAIMLSLLVLSFSIDPRTAGALLKPEAARWLPPVWFLGLSHSASGDPDPTMQTLARRAIGALAIVVAATLATYVLSYRRHRILFAESISNCRPRRYWAGRLLDVLFPDPRQQAVASFVLRTLGGSAQHRTILAAYGGFGLAVLLSALMGIGKLFPPEMAPTAVFVYAHMILGAFLLIGLKHLFSLPVELGANWAFRIVERQGRLDWMRAVDRLVLCGGVAVFVVLPLPMELALLGWRALSELALFTAVAMLAYEWAFASWAKLPFTCSYLPGKTPAWAVALTLLGLLIGLPAVSGALVFCLHNPLAFVPAMAATLAAWRRLHRSRRLTWGRQPVSYEDVPDPEIHGLNLLR
jgi:hypothetical protein